MSTVFELERLLARAKRLQVKIDKTKADIKAAGCEHLPKHVYVYEQDADDGYGRWWKVKKMFCQICAATHTYGNWHAKKDD